jgi:curved DNA-binding protein CbpA
MSDHYRTLGLQPDASKSDIRDAYFRLAHRYHPDHHAHADAAGRAAAAASFRNAKDAYDVLSDDGRRAEYDRIIRPSSTASGNRHGPYGGGASSSSTGSSSRSTSGNRHGPYGGGASSSSTGYSESSSSTDYWESLQEELARGHFTSNYYLEKIRLLREEQARRGQRVSLFTTSEYLEKIRLIREELERARSHGGGNQQGQYSSSRRHAGSGRSSSTAGAWGERWRFSKPATTTATADCNWKCSLRVLVSITDSPG